MWMSLQESFLRTESFPARSLQCKPCWNDHRGCHAFRLWISRAKPLVAVTYTQAKPEKADVISSIAAHSLVHPRPEWHSYLQSRL